MTLGNWPYLPGQCPRCHYVHEITPPFLDDSGYEIVGFCRHPRIGMQLFIPKQRKPSENERCPCFHPAPASTSGQPPTR